jgi:uncharacterized coiled-coil protein SlyX
MSQTTEATKRLVAFKQRLEKRVEELETELRELQATLEAVNSILLERGFRRAGIAKPPAEVEALPPKEEVAAERAPLSPQIPPGYESASRLEAVTGELLATLYVSDDLLRVVPAEDKNFNVNTAPFTHFLVGKVLAKMQEKDSELVGTGGLSPDKIFSYNIVREGDVIREIIIKHVDQDRLRELKSSIRWTLEKMYEKTGSQG